MEVKFAISYAPRPWLNGIFAPHVIADHIMRGARACYVWETTLFRSPFCTLSHFEYERRRFAAPILVVVPLSGIRAPLLYDMLTALLPDCDLHVLAWTDPVEIPAVKGPFGLDDNIASVLDALRVLGAGIHLVGLCQSALPALAAASILSATNELARPASLTLIGGKLDTRISPTRVDRMTRNCPLSFLERQVVTLVSPLHIGHGRLIYPANLQAAMTLAYVNRHILSGGEVLTKMLHDDGEDVETHPFLELLLSAVAVPGEFFLDTVSTVFQEFSLPRGRLRWRGMPVDPATITDTALLTIEGEFDDISGPGQTYVAHKLCRAIPAAGRAHYLQPGVGHFGLFHGAVWRSAILPRLCAFITEHRR